MKQQVADIWMKALMSGKYKQGKHWLHEKKAGRDFHCAMGVLCEEAVAAGVEVYVGKDRWGNSAIFTYEFRSVAIPDSVRDWAGLRSKIGSYGKRGRDLVKDNDHRGHSFKQITATILTHVDEL